MKGEKMKETIFDTEAKIKQGQEDLAIEFSNRMKYRLQVINPDIFKTFFGKAISFNYQELGGRHNGPAVYLSKAVAERIKKDQEGVENPPRPNFRNTRQEHVVPKLRYVRNYFYKSYIAIHNDEMKNIFTADYFKAFFKNVCVICFVTLEENEKFSEKGLTNNFPNGIILDFDHPEKIKKSEVWSRYKEAGIDVVKPLWEGNKLVKYDPFKF